MLFKKTTKLEEVKKLEETMLSKDYQKKLEELLIKKPSNQIEDSFYEKNEEQIEILKLLYDIKTISHKDEVMYIKEAFNYGNLSAGIKFLKKYCYLYPEDSIKIFNILSTISDEYLYKEVFSKEEKTYSNKEYFSHLKTIYLNTFIGISYLKLDRPKLAEKHLKIADEKIVSIPFNGFSIATFNLGILNYKKGNFEQAKEYFNKCIVKENEANHYLAMIAIKENDILTAIQYLKKTNTYSAKRDYVVLKLKHFFSYNTINESIELLEKENSTLITADENLLGELYLIKKEITFDQKYKEQACYSFAKANNLEKLKILLEKNDISILNGIAVLRDRIRGNEELTNISITASNKLKEIEGFNMIEENLFLENYMEGYQFRYNPNEIN